MIVAAAPLPNAPPPLSPLRLRMARVARRSIGVGVAKRLLPVVALALLSLVGLWPEISQDAAGRFPARSGGVEVQSGELTRVRYNGVDDRGRPYTMTAAQARQMDPDRIDLTAPKADLSPSAVPGGAGSAAGPWLMLQADRGVYAPRDGQLDLSGNVLLYRDDGLMLVTELATVDLHAGVVVSPAQVHVEGPFGTLDAQSFTVTDRGFSAHFRGPGRLVLNGKQPMREMLP